MPDCKCTTAATTVANKQKTCNKTTVATAAADNITTTTTKNCSKSSNETVTVAPDNANTLTAPCPCGHFNLDKLAAESRCEAFKSSNIVLAISNSIIVFTMIVLQEILKNECRSQRLNLDQLFLITSAIAALGDGLQINNPPPFTS